MSVKLKEPCADCPASEACWNYAKEPNPRNPAGPFRLVSWFECDKTPPEGWANSNAPDDGSTAVFLLSQLTGLSR
jgi:hypothetical protein